jgi:hypothetical protein
MNIEMKLFSGIVACLLLAGQLFAQTPYKGGQGDGYDSDAISLTLSLNETVQKIDFSISPNPVKSGQTVKIKLLGKQGDQKYRIRLIDIIGNSLLEKEFMANQSFMFDLQDSKLNPGLYIIEIRKNNLFSRKRLNVID